MKSFLSTARYQSSLVSPLKQKAALQDRMKKDLSPLMLDFGCVRFHFPRHFGFCYGVENAIDITLRALSTHSSKRIFLLSELIHNPYINNYFKERGVRFLMRPDGTRLIDFDMLTSEDAVIIPAFGTTLEIEEELTKRNISFETYQSTCPFVVKVWNRARKIATEGYSIIIHGTPNHEETRATFSHVKKETACVVVRDIKQAHRLATYIRGEKTQQMFEQEFEGLFSKGFHIEKHLVRIALVNQTTMLAEETKAISTFFKNTLTDIHGGEADVDINYYMANTSDTLCYATNDNQRALESLLTHNADVVFAVGGYNSSNTSHLVEMSEARGLPTYFIDSPLRLKDAMTIEHFDIHTKSITSTDNYMPQKQEQPINFFMIGGASCPDILIEKVIKKILTFYPCAKLQNSSAVES